MGSLLSSQSQLPPPPSSSAGPNNAASAASRQWMVLAPYGGVYGEACNDITGDPKTTAVAAISNGRRISVSLRHDPSSALARICLCFLPGVKGEDSTWACSTSAVVAAHGGSVLLQITSKERNSSWYARDYFVYSYSSVVAAAAAAAPRPPFLYLLPGGLRGVSAAGILWCGEAEFVVAELNIVGSKEAAAEAAAARGLIAFELRLFRHGKGWCVHRPLIIEPDEYFVRDKLWARWETTNVVPLGDGKLCWVDWHSGVIFTDVLDDDEGPKKLQYVRYTDRSASHRRDRFVCTDVRGALRLVSMAPHRCSHCGCAEHDAAFDIWTLKTDDMAWVLETETNMVDSADLWMLPSRPGYARAHLVYPALNTNGGGGDIVERVDGGRDHVSDKSSASVEEDDENMSLTVSNTSATSVEEEDENMKDSEDAVSDESSVPMEEEDKHMSLSVSVSASSSTAIAAIDDELQGGNEATSAATADQQHGDNGPTTVGRWPKRRRLVNSMVTGPQ